MLRSIVRSKSDRIKLGTPGGGGGGGSSLLDAVVNHDVLPSPCVQVVNIISVSEIIVCFAGHCFYSARARSCVQNTRASETRLVDTDESLCRSDLSTDTDVDAL